MFVAVAALNSVITVAVAQESGKRNLVTMAARDRCHGALRPGASQQTVPSRGDPEFASGPIRAGTTNTMVCRAEASSRFPRFCGTPYPRVVLITLSNSGWLHWGVSGD